MIVLSHFSARVPKTSLGRLPMYSTVFSNLSHYFSMRRQSAVLLSVGLAPPKTEVGLVPYSFRKVTDSSPGLASVVLEIGWSPRLILDCEHAIGTNQCARSALVYQTRI